MTFATVYSGIGGADRGFLAAGCHLLWQCEANPFRRAVLARHFRAAAIVPNVATLTAWPQLARPDLLYAELPDHRVDQWWRGLAPAVLGGCVPRRWLVVGLSPTVRCDTVLRDLAVAGWSFRFIRVEARVQAAQLAPDEWYLRRRAFALAAPDEAAVDAIGMTGVSGTLTTVADVPQAHGSLAWHEVIRALPLGASCACGTEPCVCDPAARLAAITDATSPPIARWLADLLTCAWTSTLSRSLMRADGTEAAQKVRIRTGKRWNRI